MKSIRPLLSFLIVACTIYLAAVHGIVPAGVFLFVAGNMISPPSAHLCVTLTATEILLDIIQAFAKNFPAINRMGIDWTVKMLKLNQQYIARIPSLPSVSTYDPTTGYANGATAGRSLLTDVPITVDMHRHVPVKWLHLDSIKDQINKYNEVINLAGYVLAKYFVDDLLSLVNTHNFSQARIAATADFDMDVISVITGDMNKVGALPSGRVLFVNTDVANTLAADIRLSSALFYNQRPEGDSIRSWRNVGGFALIQEYADFPSNNGTALTSVSATASTDVVAKTAHGLITGDPVIVTFGSGFTGLTTGTKYYVIKIDADSFYLASTNALAAAGTHIDITADGTGATVTKSENLVAFAFDSRAFAALAGIPDNFDQGQLAAQLGVPQVMGMQSLTDPDTGITMAAVSWQQQGTGDLFYSPTMVWGKALGRQGTASAVGAKTDYAGERIISA